jgi:superfamily I DNA/RNA helicase
VLGGAGTGKTVVAMHRAKHLAEHVFNQKNDRILFTTFTKNLAVDIETNLRKICSPEAIARIEVTNLDQWASDFLLRNGYRQKALFDAEESEAWASALNQASPDFALTPGFYRSEWEQVVQGQGLTTEEAYVQAPRLGRGTRLTRDQRRKVWKVFQEYRAQLLEHGQKELVDMIRDCRQLIEKAGTPGPYRAVIVDEGQDFGNEAFKLIRALAPAGTDDLFIVGDAHQRIYRQEVSLGKCGIDIRGRGKKLRLNYRTTAETHRFAINLLTGLSADDLDGGQDDSKGMVSLTHGSSPTVLEFDNPSAELKHLVAQISELQAKDVPLSSICVAARTTKIRDQVVSQLMTSGLSVVTIHGNKADRQSQVGIRAATLHRVKGLEFDYVFIVSANDGLVPPKASLKSAEDDVARQALLKSERSLLYVGATRARKGVHISSSGRLSTLLRPSC